MPSKSAKYKLYLMGIQDVRWGKGGSEPANDYTYNTKRLLV